MDIYDDGSMDERGLLLLQCQFLHHIWHCKKCQGNGLLPDFLCRDGIQLSNALIIWTDVKESYELDSMSGKNRWKEAEQKQTNDPLLSFWPGTN